MPHPDGKKCALMSVDASGDVLHGGQSALVRQEHGALRDTPSCPLTASVTDSRPLHYGAIGPVDMLTFPFDLDTFINALAYFAARGVKDLTKLEGSRSRPGRCVSTPQPDHGTGSGRRQLDAAARAPRAWPPITGCRRPKSSTQWSTSALTERGLRYASG
jgi:hypothetical protein